MRSLQLYDVTKGRSSFISSRNGVRNLHIAQDKIDHNIRGAVKAPKEPISQARIDRLAALPKRTNKVRNPVSRRQALLIRLYQYHKLDVEQLLKKS